MRHFRIRLYLRARDGLAKAVAQRLPQKNGNAHPLRPRPRAGRESIDADQLMGVKSAASATGAVDRAPPAFDVKATDLSFCAALKHIRDLREARPHCCMAKCGRFRPPGDRKVPNGGHIHWPSPQKSHLIGRIAFN